MFLSRKLVTGLAAIVLLGGGCVAKQPETSTTTSTAPQQKEATVPPEKGQMAELPEVKVGVMAPLSGSSKSQGEDMRRAVQLAQKELGLEKVEFIFEDSKCEGKAASAAITKLINTDTVVAVIGGVCPEATAAAASVAEQNKVVIISPATTASTLSDAGDFVFRTIPSDASQAVFAANLAYQKGARKLAVLHTSDDYGAAFSDVLKEAFPKLGGEVVASERVTPGLVSVKAQLTKIKAADPDGLYIISNSPTTAAAALKQVRDLNLNIRVFGSEGLKNDQVIAGAKGAAENLVVSSVSQGSDPFIELYKKEFGLEPGLFAAQTYDAVQILAVAFRDKARTGEEIRDALYGISLSGVSGRIEFDQKGDIQGSYNVFVVKDGAFEKE